ncbi:LytR/AlgR family response regulator transcription factor [Asticcacaulis sp.]|uniref:LytR/AlgR family response regulator transcription factor n=1 Tax=Asticcacaulis sp. TaxID=1872648 RepID=UPI00391D8CDA
MLDIVIIDDEAIAISRLVTLLKSCEGVRLVGTAMNATEALHLVTTLHPDLILLDIAMPGLSGIELGKRLRVLDTPPDIIFVTAFGRFAVEAFGLGVTDYLLKPVEPQRLREALDRARRAMTDRELSARVRELEHIVKRLRNDANSDEAPGLWLDNQRGRIRVRYADIIWIAAERDYVHVHLKERSFFIRGRLSEYESELSAHGFTRVHRSSLVQKSLIAAISNSGDRRYELTMSNGARVQVSRKFSGIVRALTK